MIRYNYAVQVNIPNEPVIIHFAPSLHRCFLFIRYYMKRYENVKFNLVKSAISI